MNIDVDGSTFNCAPKPEMAMGPTLIGVGYLVHTSSAVQASGVQGVLQNGCDGTNSWQLPCSVSNSSGIGEGVGPSKNRPSTALYPSFSSEGATKERTMLP